MKKVEIGKIYTSNKCGDFVLLRYVSSQRKYEVRFLETGTVDFFQWVSIASGSVKDRNRPSVYGVGFVGYGKYKTSENRKRTTAYSRWSKMMCRCYSGNHSSYKDCTAAEEWHNFQNFAKWHYENFPSCTKFRYELDKDSIIAGNKVYGPETCMYIKKAANLAEVSSRTRLHKDEVVSVFYGGEYRLNIDNSFIDEFCNINGINRSRLFDLCDGRIDEYRGFTSAPVKQIR